MTRLRIEAEVTGGGCFFHGSNAQKSQKQHAIYTYCKYAFRNAMIWRYMKKYVANGVIRKPQLVFFFFWPRAQGWKTCNKKRVPISLEVQIQCIILLMAGILHYYWGCSLTPCKSTNYLATGAGCLSSRVCD